jgi:hypothetical protein
LLVDAPPWPPLEFAPPLEPPDWLDELLEPPELDLLDELLEPPELDLPAEPPELDELLELEPPPELDWLDEPPEPPPPSEPSPLLQATNRGKPDSAPHRHRRAKGPGKASRDGLRR